MAMLVDSAVLMFGLIYYGFLSLVFVLRAYEKTEQELRLKYVFSLQLLPFTALFLTNLYLNLIRKSITLVPLLMFFGYDLWYRALTEKKPLHHPDKWPIELIIYLILLYAGGIGLNWYGFLVSKQYGIYLVVGFFVMVGAYGNYQIRYNRKKRDQSTA